MARDILLFARNFFRHPMMLGSIVPSSRFLIRELLTPVDWTRARVIVEYGPGVGGITAEVLRRMRPEARADYIISGIPLGSMPGPLRQRILHRTRDVLAPGGAFLVYQITTRALPDLKRIFGYVARRFEPLNVLPAHLFFCQPAAA